MTNERDAMIDDVLAFECMPVSAEDRRRSQLELLSNDALAEIVADHRKVRQKRPAIRVVLLGPPESEKGPQSARLAECFCVPHLSTSALLQAAIARGSDLGRRIAQAMNAGELVDDGIVMAVIMERLWREDVRDGFVLDGFPRTLSQAKALDAHLAAFGASLDAVIEIAVEPSLLTNLITSRAQAARPPGTPAPTNDLQTLKRRSEAYIREIPSLIAYYDDGRGLYFRIEGSQTAEEVAAEIRENLDHVIAERTKRAEAMPARLEPLPPLLDPTSADRASSGSYFTAALMGVALTLSVLGALLLNKLWE